jgi:hypothetical protein
MTFFEIDTEMSELIEQTAPAEYYNDGTSCKICGRGFQYGEWVCGTDAPEFSSLCVKCAQELDLFEIDDLTINEPYVFRGD